MEFFDAMPRSRVGNGSQAQFHARVETWHMERTVQEKHCVLA